MALDVLKNALFLVRNMENKEQIFLKSTIKRFEIIVFFYNYCKLIFNILLDNDQLAQFK